MLTEILRAIQRDRLLSKPRLAAEFKASEEVIDQAVQHLIDMGYLIKEEMGQDCGTACSSCPYATACGKVILTTYRISDKGESHLARQGE